MWALQGFVNRLMKVTICSDIFNVRVLFFLIYDPFEYTFA